MKDLKWSDYLDDRLIAQHSSGFSIIVPKSRSDYTPMLCPLCRFALTSLYDEGAHRKFGCCDKCAAKWAYPRAKEWESGWRPSQQEVDSEIKTRTTQA